MKYLIFTCVLFLAVSVNAQHIRFGVKGGGELSLFNANAPQYIAAKAGFGGYAGGLFEIGKFDGSKAKLQFELVASQRVIRNEYKVEDIMFSDRNISLFQISAPVLFRYFVTPSLSFNAGGALNYNVHARGKTHSIINNSTIYNNYMESDQLAKLQGSLLFGLNYYYQKGFFLDIRYNLFPTHLLRDISPRDYSDMLHTIQVGVGFKFPHHSKVHWQK